jgi:hypothetical protein
MSDYQWCLLCQRASKKRFRNELPDRECPFEDCDGYMGNLWDWDSFTGGRSDLPGIPEEGKIYNL